MAWTVLSRAAEPARTDPSPLGQHRWAATIQSEEFGPFEMFWVKGEHEISFEVQSVSITQRHDSMLESAGEKIISEQFIGEPWSS